MDIMYSIILIFACLFSGITMALVIVHGPKRFLNKLRLLTMSFVRSANAPLEKKYVAKCPYCSMKCEDHKGVHGVHSLPESWDKLNQIYLLSCYKNRWSKKDWHVITFTFIIFRVIFSARKNHWGWPSGMTYQWNVRIKLINV